MESVFNNLQTFEVLPVCMDTSIQDDVLRFAEGNWHYQPVACKEQFWCD
jgi:hypothetical protein